MLSSKISEVQKFHDKETERYIAERYSGNSCEHFSYLSRKRIVLDYLQGARGSILDAGCGPAIFSRELVGMGLRPCCVDLSLGMLKKACSLAKLGDKAQWVNCEIERLPFQDEAFDNLMSIGVLAYANDTLNAVRELTRVLRPGGLLIVQCSNSLAPTPIIQSIKDNMLFSLGLRQKRWHFELDRHSYGHFRKILEKCGLHIRGKKSYDFRLPFIEKFFPRIAIHLMRKNQTILQNSNLLGWLGEGYVVKARKMK
jgi:ubiquinone/menaquinone biosynthesis C-methylase UbiE